MGDVKSHLQSKLVPPGPANLAPKPVVIQADERKNGISFPTTIKGQLCVSPCE